MRLRYLTCNHSLCSIYRLLSKEVFYYLGDDRSIGYQSKEETITDLLMRELMFWKQNNSYSKFDIRVFSRQQERLNGADFEWDWYFVDGSGKKWLGFRIQAKILNLKTNKFKYLYKQNGHQLNTLMSSSHNDNRIPYYCFYLHKEGGDPLRGCSLSSYNNIIKLLNTSKTPNVNDVISKSFPWHFLFCNCNFRCSCFCDLRFCNCDFKHSSKDSLPEVILKNLQKKRAG